jgi:S1-C subfamily serine protease
MKRGWTIALVGMALITLVMLGAFGVVIYRNTLGGKPGLQFYIQAPPLAELGQDIQLTLTAENNGEGYASIDEIMVPNALTDAAVVKEVFPSLFPGVQKFYGEVTGYRVGIMLEPGERREFTLRLMPWQIADVAGEMFVVSGGSRVPVAFRMLFNRPVAAAATATALPTPVPTWTPTAQPTVIPTPSAIPLPFRSVVKIIAKTKYGSLLREAWSGSGTIISTDGLILTNAHLVTSMMGIRPSAYVIGMTIDPAEPAVEMYYAEPVLADEDLDIAIVQITTDLKHDPVDWKKAGLVPITLGDSENIQLGDPLTILGYPGIGGETITLTNGAVGGFTAQRSYGERAFIKTAASISGGTSGGVALNASGQMIAIPTQLGSGLKDALVDCRLIADTNGDGRINDRDTCVPVGGFINAMRPINLARALIDTALRMGDGSN